MKRGAHTTAAQVITDPVLLRCITSFQHGLPLPLYDFWSAHHPAANTPHWNSGTLIKLVELVVKYGTPALLEYTSQVRIYVRDDQHDVCDDYEGECEHSDDDNEEFIDKDPLAGRWLVPDLSWVWHSAIENSRADMLQWCYVNKMEMGKPHLVWRHAIDHFQDSPAVLEALLTHQPNAQDEFTRIARSYILVDHIKSPRLFQWLYANMPGAIAPSSMIATAVAKRDLRMVQFVSEQYRHELGGASLWLFKRAARNHDIKIMQYLMEHLTDGISESEATTFLREETPEFIRSLVHMRGYASLVQRLVAR